MKGIHILLNILSPYVTGTYLGIECVKLTNFFITFSSLLRQTQYIEIMTREGATKTVHFVTPAMSLVPVRGHTSHVLNFHHSFLCNSDFLLQ